MSEIEHPKVPELKPFKPVIPDGWWSMPDMRGTREGVLKAISAAETVPAHWRAALTEEINRLDAKFNMVELHAHYHMTPGAHSLHLTIKPSTALV